MCAENAPRAVWDDATAIGYLGRGCVSSMTLAAWIEGSLPAEASRAVSAHVRSCVRCYDEGLLASAFTDGRRALPARAEDLEFVIGRTRETIARTIGDMPGGSRPRRRLPLLPAILVAAAAGLAAFWLGNPFSTAPSPTPLSGDASNLRGGEVTLRAPLGEVDALPERFVWQSVAGADHYRLVILDVGKTILRDETGPSTEWRVPAGGMGLRRATRYHWRVDALGGGGETLASSADGSFIVPPEAAGAELERSPR